MPGLIALVAGIIFIPFIGNCPLFDWDEINFAECAREMVVSGNYSQVQLNFRPFWEKPPGFIWMQALSMNIFGVNEFAARFPNAVCSIVSFVALYLIGKKFQSPRFGILWCLIYASLILPHLYFKSGIIDPWFNLFIFLSVYHIIIFTNNPFGKREIFNSLAAGLFLGLAVLTKGPAAIVIVGLTLLVYFTWSRQLKLIFSRTFLIFAFSTLFFAGSWFLVMWLKGNQDVIKEFIDYQVRLMSTEDSGHGGPFIYHFVVILLGCFPASLIFIASYTKYVNLSPFQKQFRKIFICLFWVVILLFSFLQTKIIHYSSLCYYPLTFVATIGLVNYFKAIRFSVVLKVIYWIISILITAVFAALPFIDSIKKTLLSGDYIKDEFAKENLKAEVHWTGFEFLISLLFLAGSICIYLAVTRKNKKLVYYGLVLNLFFIYSAILVIIPRVELYTQHAAIEFYKACAKNKCYVETNNFKSYAYLFYSDRQPGDYKNPDQIKSIEHHLTDAEKAGFTRHSFYANANCYWMKHGNIDRPAYIIAKKSEEKDMFEEKDFRKLYDKNGFSFFVRMPVKAQN